MKDAPELPEQSTKKGHPPPSYQDRTSSLTIRKQKFDYGVSKQEKYEDGRLAPAYFSPSYKYFDQLLQLLF